MNHNLPAGATRPVRRSTLVVAPLTDDLSFVLSALPVSEFTVMVASSFSEARSLIAVDPPTVLVTELRLHHYNGLNLVHVGKASQPMLAAVVMSGWADFMSRVDAEAMGATFVLRPTSPEELATAIRRTICKQPGDAPVRPPFDRRRTERRETPATVPPQTERRLATDRRGPFPGAGTAPG